ncbi:hypothetical protein ACMZ89_06440, partial [Gardnerella vaginalis]|uniref:hypothetical protein n=1 Tax=Gardnerella vaginalis TaxID=2702 RepID=UPI0039F05CBA
KITADYKTSSTELQQEVDKSRDKANDMSDGLFEDTPEYQNAQSKGDYASKQALDTYKKALEDANKVLGDKNATQAQ